MGNLNGMQDVVVVNKGQRKNSKIYIHIFKNVRVDDILDTNKRKPLIPYENEILEIGVGSSFEEKYRKKYNL